MRVLLLGAGGSAAWNFARAVGDEHELIGADVDPLMLELSACPENVQLKTGLEGVERLHEVVRVCDEYGIEFIHAQPDAEVAWLAQWRDHLEAETFLPTTDALELCADKLGTAQWLGRDLAARSYNVSVGAFERGLHGEAWMRLRTGAGSMGALPVRSWAMAQEWIEHWYETRGLHADAWMMAEILPGRDLSWTGVYVGGQLVASACKEREALMGASRHPANVASTATVQRIVFRPDVNRACERAVLEIDSDAQGVWMMDLREDAEGTPKITEVNCGRFGTTSLFWAEAGCSLPKAYLNAAEHGHKEGFAPYYNLPQRDVCRIGATWVRQPDMGARLATEAMAHA